MAYMSDAKKILARLEREALADAAVQTAHKRKTHPNWTASGFAEDMYGLTVISLPDWKQQRAWAYWHGYEYLTREQALALLSADNGLPRGHRANGAQAVAEEQRKVVKD